LGYRYAHDFENNFAFMEFLPEEVKGMVFFEPGNNPREEEMRKYLRERWKDRYGY
jgi:putative ATPase